MGRSTPFITSRENLSLLLLLAAIIQGKRLVWYADLGHQEFVGRILNGGRSTWLRDSYSFRSVFFA